MVIITITLVPFQILSIHSLCAKIVKYAHLCIYKSLQVHHCKKTKKYSKNTVCDCR